MVNEYWFVLTVVEAPCPCHILCQLLIPFCAWTIFQFGDWNTGAMSEEGDKMALRAPGRVDALKTKGYPEWGSLIHVDRIILLYS